MEIFINEVSLEGQYLTEAEFRDSIREFTAIFELINQKVQNKKLYKEDSEQFTIYEAIKGSNFQASLNQIKDKSLKIAFKNIVFNKLNPKEWRKERLHLGTDYFDYLTIDNNYEPANNTSLAEVAERKLQNDSQNYLLINFINSSFKIAHPQIRNCCLVTIVKNNDEIKQICIDALDNKLALENWLDNRLNLGKTAYPPDANYTPRDEQTILVNITRFKKTNKRYDERIIYCEVSTDRYWYVDNLHKGLAAHLEVFDKEGNHIGEANLQGTINIGKRDKDKKLNLS